MCCDAQYMGCCSSCGLLARRRAAGSKCGVRGRDGGGVGGRERPFIAKPGASVLWGGSVGFGEHATWHFRGPGLPGDICGGCGDPSMRCGDPVYTCGDTSIHIESRRSPLESEAIGPGLGPTLRPGPRHASNRPQKGGIRLTAAHLSDRISGLDVLRNYERTTPRES